MTKTVTAMLAHKLAAERGLDTSRRVVESFGPGAGGAPAWAAAWRADSRAAITLDDLMSMRDGLANDESYAAWGAVPRMLFGATDTAAHAAQAGAAAAPGARWRYLSASTNIAARVLRSHFDTDTAYWAWPRQALFDPIGATSAVLETDADGTWIGSSYLWASSGDWARLGQLMLDDGRWNGQAVLPPGFLARATRPAVASGEGHGYGWQTWLLGAPEVGKCAGQVPADTIAMRGHWGQIVAMVPSRRAVVVRLGWTFARDQFDGCAFVRDVLAALR
jgi:CubicO group peptidase (beta-lactamase class C family)